MSTVTVDVIVVTPRGSQLSHWAGFCGASNLIRQHDSYTRSLAVTFATILAAKIRKSFVVKKVYRSRNGTPVTLKRR